MEDVCRFGHGRNFPNASFRLAKRERVVAGAALGIADLHVADRALDCRVFRPLRARRGRGAPVAAALPLRGLPALWDDAGILRAFRRALARCLAMEPRSASPLRWLLAMAVRGLVLFLSCAPIESPGSHVRMTLHPKSCGRIGERPGSVAQRDLPQKQRTNKKVVTTISKTASQPQNPPCRDEHE